MRKWEIKWAFIELDYKTYKIILETGVNILRAIQQRAF